MPSIPQDNTVASVFSSIAGKYDQVSRYNALTKSFEHYISNPRYDQFNTIEALRGYQVYITDPQGATLTITGASLAESSSIQLKTGYNLISCPTSTETPVEQALLPLKIGVDYSKVLHYNKATQLFENYTPSIKDFTSLIPGESYYIYCLRDTTWNLTNYQSPITSFVYDGDGGRVKKTVNSEQFTVYIGSLYEVESDGAIRKHIFSGANRICTVNSKQSTVNYADHLGSSNVMEFRGRKNSGDAILNSWQLFDKTNQLKNFVRFCYFLRLLYQEVTMARIARLVVPGIPHHIVQRGNRRQRVFFSDADCMEYLNYLIIYARPAGISFWGYCLMDNHVHLIAVPDQEDSFARGFAEAHRRYTRMVNFREKWRGYLWEGRFKSCPLSQTHLYAAIRYIERNPVRAKIVENARDYPWSSAKAHVFKQKDPLLDDNFITSEINDWKCFLSDEDKQTDVKLFKMHANTGRPLGDGQFIEGIERLTGRALHKQKPGPKIDRNN